MAIHLEQTTAQNEITCAVCAMPIPDIRQAFTEEYHGLMLAFCRQDCLKDFLEDPERYVPDSAWKTPKT